MITTVDNIFDDNKEPHNIVDAGDPSDTAKRGQIGGEESTRQGICRNIATAFSAGDLESFKACLVNLLTHISKNNTTSTPLTLLAQYLANTKIEIAGKEQTLLEYALTNSTDLIADKKEMFEHLFNMLGKELIAGDPNNDPLLRACKENNIALIGILVPCYRKLMLTTIPIDPVVDRLKVAISSTESHETLQCFKNTFAPPSVTSPKPNRATSLTSAQIAAKELLTSIETKCSELLFKGLNEDFNMERKLVEDDKKVLEKTEKEMQSEIRNVGDVINSEYSWKNFGYGMAGGVVLVGAFVLMTYLVTVADASIHENSKLSADKVFNSIANWMWTALCGQPPQPSQAAVAGMLALSGGLTALVSGAVGMVVGGKQLPTNNAKL